MIKKRRALKSLVSLTALTVAGALILSGCSGGSAGGENDTITIGYGAGLCHAPLHIAIENGYFAEEGLNFEAVQIDTAIIPEAMASGQLDASFGLVAKFVQPMENGLPIKVTSGIHTGCIKIVTNEASGISSLEELKGKRIGVNGLADSPAVITQRALANVGIGVTAANLEVEFVVYSPSDLPQALENGAIDAFAATDPVASIAIENYGLTVLLDTATDQPFADEYCCVSIVSDSLAENHPDLAAKFTKAVMRASQWIEENPEETARIQMEKEYVSGDLDLNQSLLDSYSYVPSVDGGYEALANITEGLYDLGILNQQTDTNALIKKGFCHLEGVE